MSILRIVRRTKRRSERGAALVMIALSLTAMMATAGVIVDGGNAFAQRRQMQNAADSAALAGARALDKYNVSPLSYLTTSVLTAATTSATGNGGTITSCRLLDQMQNDVGACPAAINLLIPGAASAVKVTVQSTTNTSFMRVVGVNNFTVAASATAQIERLMGGNSPFVICAVGTNDPRAGAAHDGQPIIGLQGNKAILAVGSDSVRTGLDSPIGKSYTLHFTGNSAPRCGQPTSFKGLAALNNGKPITNSLPGPVSIDSTGNLGANVQPTVLAGDDACKEADGWTKLPCLVAVPLCYAMPNPPPPATATGWGVNSNDARLWCVRYGAFSVTSANSSTLNATFVDGVLGTGGQGGGAAGAGEVRVIKLSQ